MNFGRKTIIALFTISILLWIGNIYYFHSKTLKKPIFFRHLIEADINSTIRINYINNVYEDDKIYYVKIPELSNEPIYINREGSMNFMEDVLNGNVQKSNATYRDKHYNYCSLNINLADITMNYDEETQKQSPKVKGDKLITKLTFGTFDNKEFTEDIGKIYINDYKKKPDNTFAKMLKSSSGRSSDDKFQEDSNLISTKKGVKLVSIGGRFENEIKETFNITIDGKDLFKTELPFQSDKNIEIISKIKPNIESNKHYADFNSLSLDLCFEDNNKKQENIKIYIFPRIYISSDYDFSKEEIENIIKLREGR